MTTETTPEWLNFNTLVEWMSEYNNNTKHTWDKLIDFKPDKYTKTLFETTTELEFEGFNETYVETFIKTWKDLNDGYYRQSWWKSLRNVADRAESEFNEYYLDAYFENQIYTINFTQDYLFNNQITILNHIYNDHKDEIQIDFDEFTEFLRDFLYGNECYSVVDTTLSNVDNVKIPCFLAITGNQHFNLEAGNDGYSIYRQYYAENTDLNEVDNPTSQYLHKIHSDYDKFINSDNPSKTVTKMREALINAGDNVTLGMPIVLTIGKIRELFNTPYPAITIPAGAQLGYHGYIYGNGSVGFVTITNPINITLQPGEWTLVPEGTYGYSMFDTYGMERGEIEDMNGIDNLMINDPIFLDADLRYQSLENTYHHNNGIKVSSLI